MGWDEGGAGGNGFCWDMNQIMAGILKEREHKY